MVTSWKWEIKGEVVRKEDKREVQNWRGRRSWEVPLWGPRIQEQTSAGSARKARFLLSNLNARLDVAGRSCCLLVFWTLPLESESVSLSVVSDPLRPHRPQPARFLHPWDSPDQNTGMGCRFLLQGLSLTQGSNPGSPALQAGSLPSEPPGKPHITPGALGKCQSKRFRWGTNWGLTLVIIEKTSVGENTAGKGWALSM